MGSLVGIILYWVIESILFLFFEIERKSTCHWWGVCSCHKFFILVMVGDFHNFAGLRRLNIFHLHRVGNVHRKCGVLQTGLTHLEVPSLNIGVWGQMMMLGWNSDSLSVLENKKNSVEHMEWVDVTILSNFHELKIHRLPIVFWTTVACFHGITTLFCNVV